MADKIPKRNKPKSHELLNPIILLEHQEKEDLEPCMYIDHICHNNPRDTTPGKDIIKIPRYDLGAL